MTEKRISLFICAKLKEKESQVKLMLYVNDLWKSYTVGKKEYPVLKGVSLEVAQGEFVAVMGPSGSGASVKIRLS